MIAVLNLASVFLLMTVIAICNWAELGGSGVTYKMYVWLQACVTGVLCLCDVVLCRGEIMQTMRDLLAQNSRVTYTPLELHQNYQT